MYNLSGALVEETYPSGRKVKNTLEADGDLARVETLKPGGAWAIRADSFSYNAAGAVTSLRLGNNRWESTVFNARLQPTRIALGTAQNGTDMLKLDYGYGTTDNNGNVLSQTITVPTVGATAGFTATQAYTYDSLNRLKDAKEMIGATQTWKQTFVFDRYGNRNFDQANTTQPSSFANPGVSNPAVNQANNRFAAGQGWAYDASGNTTADPNGQTFVYDAENKQVSVSNSGGTIGQYFYDGDGKRVKKVVPSTNETTIFVYDASAKLVAEYSTNLSPTPEVKYLTADNLGSPRIVTAQNGSVVSRTDYMPYGEEIIGLGGRSTTQAYVADDVRQGFTGYERDPETNLDFAQARMYQNGYGRFTSPDPLLSSAKPPLPQSWNRFSYANNSPIVSTDPLGLYVCSKNTTTKECDQFEDALQKARDNLAKIEKDYGKDSKAYKLAEKALAVYGKQGEKNGVVIFSEDGKGAGRTTVSGIVGEKTEENPTGQEIWVKFDKDLFSNSNFDNAIFHEGSHAAYGSDWVKNGFKNSSNPSVFQLEYDGYYLNSVYAEVTGATSFSVPTTQEYGLRKPYKQFTWPTTLWNSSWEKADVETLRQSNIEFHLRNDKLYKLTPQSKELSFQRGTKNR